MESKKTGLLVHESVFWVNMNVDIGNTIKQCSTCPEDQNMQPQEKTTPYEVLAKLWEVVGTNIIMINNQNLLCIVYYCSKITLVKNVDSLSAEDLI